MSKKTYEKQCLKCQKFFKFAEGVTPEPHLCPDCDKFFKDFNSQEKRINKIIPKKVTKNASLEKMTEKATPAPIIMCPNIPPILLEKIEEKAGEEQKKD